MANPFENVSFGAPVQQRPTQPLFPAEAAPAENPTAAAGQSIIEQLLARIKGGEDPATTGAADIGQVAGSLANDERLNRMSKGAFTQNYDRTMLNGSPEGHVFKWVCHNLPLQKPATNCVP